MTILYDDAAVTYDSPLFTYDGDAIGGGGTLLEGPPIRLVGRRPETNLVGVVSATSLVGRRPADIQFPSLLVAR